MHDGTGRIGIVGVQLIAIGSEYRIAHLMAAMLFIEIQKRGVIGQRLCNPLVVIALGIDRVAPPLVCGFVRLQDFFEEKFLLLVGGG